jgi:lipoprotein NlpI
MKRYLRNYCNYQQNDWTNWLFIIEYAFNVCISSFIELFSFMTNYDVESRVSFDFISIDDTAKERILTKKRFDIFKKMKEIWEFIKKKCITAQKSQKHQADKIRKNSSDYKVEDLVWLFIKNIKTSKSFKKLDHKMIDSYKVTKILKNACQLNLSDSMKIHNNFISRCYASRSSIF